MRAVRCLSPGGPEALIIEDVAEPRLEATQLLIDVKAAALNRADLLQRRGLYPPPPGASDILGLECAGVVCEVGASADPAWRGRRVMALLPGGGYAERVSIDARLAVEIPQELDFVQAAAVPEAFMTANEALFECGGLRPGELLLVPAAAGGVGSAAVQLGLCQGAKVVGLASGSERCSFVESFGAQAIDRTNADVAHELRARYGERPVDVLLDFLGPRAWPGHAPLLADGGRVVIVGLLAGGAVAEVDFGQLLRRAQSLRGLVMRTRSLEEKIATTRRFTRNVLPLFRSGRLRVHIDSVFALHEAAAAHRHMEANANKGKIVLTLDSPSVVVRE